MAREGPSQPWAVFARRLVEAREAKPWTQRQLAERLDAIGSKLDRATIAKIESGSIRAENIRLTEVLAIAAALEVSPMHLFVPLENDREVAITPEITATAAETRAWVRGQRPLDGDGRYFYYQAPPDDYGAVLPGVAVQFRSTADFDVWQRTQAAEAVTRMLDEIPGTPVRRPGDEETGR